MHAVEVSRYVQSEKAVDIAAARLNIPQEAISDTIALPEDPDTIKAMLQCAYGIRPPILQHKDYIATRPELAAVAAQLDALMLLFCAVDKYDLEKDVRDDLAASVRVRLEQLQNPLSIVSFACALHERTGERSHDLVDVVARCINDKLFVIVGHKAASERLLSNKSLMKRVLVHAAAANGAMTAYSAYPQGSSALERQLQQDLQSQRQHLARLQLQQRPQRPQQLSSQLAGPQPARQ